MVDGKAKTTTMSIAVPLGGEQPEIRFMVAITDFRYTDPSLLNCTGLEHQTVFNVTEFSIAIEAINAVICKPSYSIAEANLTTPPSRRRVIAFPQKLQR